MAVHHRLDRRSRRSMDVGPLVRQLGPVLRRHRLVGSTLPDRHDTRGCPRRRRFWSRSCRRRLVRRERPGRRVADIGEWREDSRPGRSATSRARSSSSLSSGSDSTSSSRGLSPTASTTPSRSRRRFSCCPGSAGCSSRVWERLLRPWDFFHSPAVTEHIFVGAGDGPCVIVMVGARSEDWRVLYPVSESRRATA